MIECVMSDIAYIDFFVDILQFILVVIIFAIMIEKSNFELQKGTWRSTQNKKLTAEQYIKENESYDEALNYAFTWYDTPQGHKFWRKLEIEWAVEN